MLPEVLTLSCPIGGAVWRISGSADLAAAFAPEGSVDPALAVKLGHELAASTAPRWRAVFDQGGVLLSAACDRDARAVAVGSPRFSHEAFLCSAAALGQGCADRERREALAALVEAWRTTPLGAGPTDLDRFDRAVREIGVDPVALAADPSLDAATRALAARLERAMAAHWPSARERLSQWGLVLATDVALLRVHLLRFVSALPALDHDVDGSEVARLLRETLRRMQEGHDLARARGDAALALPVAIALAVRAGLAVTALLPAGWIGRAARAATRLVARTFIAGEDIGRAGPALIALRATDRDATLDQLGELVVCEREADQYRDRVLAMIAGLAQHRGARNSAGIPRAHISIKTSALCSDYDPDDPDGVWLRVGPRLQAILVAARRAEVFVHFDAEHYHVRDLTFAMMARALDDTAELRKWRDVGIVVQAYLRDAAEHFCAVFEFVRRRGVPMAVRLVKGAYWDAETIEATAHDHLAPQFLNKAESDAAFQALCLATLAHGDHLQLCVASHNLRDHCFAEAARARLFPTAPPIEHQALHMTYEALSTGMAKVGWAVRNYIPVGSLLVGMAYLVRRILENSSQVGVLTAARHGVDLDALLEAPRAAVAAARAGPTWARHALLDDCDGAPFRNVAPVRLDLADHRDRFNRAIAAFAPLEFGAPDRGGPRASVVSPSDGAVVGSVPTATADDVACAVGAAVEAFPAWSARPAGVRAVALVRAGERLRAERLDWAALVCHESGKSRGEALGDVDEAIDFLHYYARQALVAPGHGGLGPLAVVAPWNFPLAIPVGMVAAALGAGNPALIKSAEQTPLVVERLVALLRGCGVPAGVVAHLAGEGPAVGAPLVRDPRLAGVLFTGSQAVGCLIHQTVAPRPAGERASRVVAEMGGKNAIIVTATADLDQAVAGALRSAFGHAGQKCSAASRILVDARIAPAFCERFAAAAADLRVGEATAPGTRINPVVSLDERDRLWRTAREVCNEVVEVGGRILVNRATGPLVGPLVVEVPARAALEPEGWAQREIFGPVVHVVPCADAAEMVEVWRSPAFALTGGIFAQSQDEVDWLSSQAWVGNLYINRPITGARVAVEPFGGFHMSGTGPKAGGPGYLPALRAHPVEAVQIAPEARAVIAGLPATGSPTAVRGPAARLAPISTLVAAELARRRAWEAATTDAVVRARIGAAVTAAVRVIGRALEDGVANRAIPGQTSVNREFAAKGPVAVLAGSAAPTACALVQAWAAVCAGCKVEVLACAQVAAAAWRRSAHAIGESAPGALTVRDVTDGGVLAAHLRRTDWATVVVDGTPALWARALHVALAVAPGDRHLRQLIAAGSWPDGDDPADAVRTHLHVRTVVENTMRHGAELAIPRDGGADPAATKAFE